MQTNGRRINFMFMIWASNCSHRDITQLKNYHFNKRDEFSFPLSVIIAHYLPSIIEPRRNRSKQKKRFLSVWRVDGRCNYLLITFPCFRATSEYVYVNFRARSNHLQLIFFLNLQRRRGLFYNNMHSRLTITNEKKSIQDIKFCMLTNNYIAVPFSLFLDNN